MSKTSFFKSRLVIIAAICFLIAASAHFLSNASAPEVKGIKKSVTPTVAATPTNSTVSVTSVPTKTVLNKEVKSSATPTTSVQNNSGNNQNSSLSTPTSAPAQTAQNIQVNLSINGSSVGSVELSQGANQCDVLAKAKDQGKISSLLMKYDNSLGTNGVYQINGVGKENAIWWVYKVNGQSPSQGCSHIKANSGDSVNWEYIGL